MAVKLFENQELLARRRETIRLSEMRRRRVRPINDWVLIRKIEVKDKQSDAGVVITESQARSSTGVVIAAAPGLIVKEGDEVIFTNFPIELEDLEEVTGDKKLNLVRMEEIYAVLEPIESTETT
jgi:co-chaperonin GroES (HSP10)